MVEQQTLKIWDYTALLLALLVSLSIGIYFRVTGGKQSTANEYLLGDRNQRAVPVGISLMASQFSAITLLGVSAEVYMFGTLFLTIVVSYILFTWVAAYLYMPIYFKLQSPSVYEYLERRFGSRVRLAASLVYSLQMLLYLGVVLYAPSIALQALTGLSQNFLILVVGIVCTVYSTIGGIKAVIWTDFFQALLMYAALVSVITVAVWKHGGFLPIWLIAQHHHRIQFFDFTPDPTVRHSTFSLFIGGGFTFLSVFAVNQTNVQRYLTTRDYKTAVKSLWVSLLSIHLLIITCGLAGLAMFSIFFECDPIKSGRISSLDQVMPLFVMDTMGHIPGLSGLFAAGIFSASLSTVSASVNSLAAVTIEDYLKPLFSNKLRSQLSRSTSVIKCVTFGYGLVCVALAFMAHHLGGLLQAGLVITGIAGGPLLGTFTLGMFFPGANEPGALAGITSGLVSAVWIGFGQPKPAPEPLPLSTSGCLLISNITLPTTSSTPLPHYPYMYRVSYLLNVVISCSITLLTGLLVSCLATALGHRSVSPLNPDLFVPPVARHLQRKQCTKVLVLQETSLKNQDNKCEEKESG